MPAGRRCLTCPRIIPAASPRGRCPTCLSTWEQDRGTPTMRGYGASVWITPLGTMTYDQCRAAYQRMLNDGAVLSCACGCGEHVEAAFHLGHDAARQSVVGPMRPRCNLSLAGEARHA